MTRPRRFGLVVALLAGLLVGVAWPLGDLALACRVPESEGCVWGRSLLPLSLGAGTLLGLLVGAAAYVLMRALSRKQ